MTSRVIGGNATLRWRLTGMVWLVALLGPLSAAFDLAEPKSIIAAALLVMFTLGYVLLFTTVSPDSQRRDAVLVAILAAIALVLPAVFGEHFWLPLLFVGTAAVMVLPWRTGIACLAFMNVYAIGCGLVAGWTRDEIGDVVVSCALASMVVLSVSRLVRTVGALKVT